MLTKRYIKQLDMDISPLGAGVMRFQADNGTFSDETFRLIDIAMSLGINYFDTAYFYNAGYSEVLIREALVKKYPRDSFIIVDKLPVWICQSRDDMERVFNEQMERLGADYIDIYLLHALHKGTWLQVYNKGVLDFLDEKLKSGIIRKAGFSFHDKADNLPMIADAYDWNIAQLQINYYDWLVHDVKECYDYLESKNIPISVMGPIGGGRLVNLPPKAEEILRGVNPDKSTSSWAVRFCASLTNVAVVLSGMRSEAELRENASCFDPLAQFTSEEHAATEKAVRVFQEAGTTPCSACRYCVDDCPAGIDIPHVFQQQNDYKLFNRPAALSFYYMDLVPAERRADKCINCGKCTAICPQKIDVPSQLLKAHDEALLLSLFKNDINYEKKLLSVVDKKLILFGGGNFGSTALKFVQNLGFKDINFCDNNQKLWGTKIDEVEVISPQQLKQLYDGGSASILITNQYHFASIKNQLLELGVVPLN